MAYLILNLGLTVIVTGEPDSRDFCDYHHYHTLSENCFDVWASNGLSDVYVKTRILNPPEISALIKYALNHHDGVIFMTSGHYYPQIVPQLAQHLDLNLEEKVKLEKAPFHSTITDQVYFPDLDIDQIRAKGKRQRLEKIITMETHLQGNHFVIVDDMLLNEFKSMPFVTTVHATTAKDTTGSKVFYFEARKKLDEAKAKQVQSRSTQAPARLLAEAPIPLLPSVSAQEFFVTIHNETTDHNQIDAVSTNTEEKGYFRSCSIL